MRRYFRLPLPFIMAVLGAIVISAFSSPLAAETDFAVPPGRAPQPQTITMGPDGNLWFTEFSGLKIGKITSQGVITEYAIPGAEGLVGITTGPDGNLWFTDEYAGFIGHITTTGSYLGPIDLPLGSHPQGIVTGPDSRLWFVDNSVDLLHPMYGFRIGAITTGGTLTEYPTYINPIVFEAFATAGQITVGPDGNLWFTNANTSAVQIQFVGRITTTGTVTTFPTHDTPGGITSGPDGNLWVIENNHVAKVSTAGVETECKQKLTYSGDGGITTGSDGNIWFTEAYQVGNVIPATCSVTEFGFAATNYQSYLTGLVTGPNADLWVLSNLLYASVVDVTTAGQFANIYYLSNQGSFPAWSTLGPDGAVWFSEPYADLIQSMDTNGNIMQTCQLTQGSQPHGIVTGPDHNLWFVEAGTYNIAKMTTDCAIQEFSVGQTYPGLWEIAVGPDGNLWFTESAAAYNNIVRITTNGVMTPVAIPTPNALALYETSGPDGNVWFTEQGAQKIANVNPTTLQVTECPYPGSNKPPEAIVAGPDGNLWIMIGTAYGAIAKFSTSCNVLGEFPAQFQTDDDIRVGTDGAIWFDPWYPDTVGRITTAGVVSSVPLVAVNTQNGTPTFGTDGKIWITLGSSGTVGRLSAIGGTGLAISPMAGTQFNGPVASFVDGTPTATQANFTSIIDWGDGTGTTPGTVSGPTGGPFTVSGTHTYSSSGAYAVNVSLSDTVDNSTYQASPGSAQVTSGQVNYLLTGSVNGDGSVTSTDGNINCPGTCGYSYASNTPVALNASPAPGWSFSAWSGACSGSGSCNVIMTENLSVKATFTQSQGFATLTVSTTGSGTVTSTDGFITCPETCSHTYASNTQVTLNATPGQGGTFSGWGGACSGTGPCNVTMTQNLSLTAAFTAQQDMLLHSFGSGNDGQNPIASLIADSAGNLYGTTSGGGTNREGTVFEVSVNGIETILHNFGSGNDGQTPFGSLIFDSAGNLYGTTSAGGVYGYGIVFELSPNGTETVLYNFGAGMDGANPSAGLVFDTSGNLYGTTVNGGLFGGGAAFELSPNGGGGWTETGIYSFGGTPTDGLNPYSQLVFDSSGNLYGTTQNGGLYGAGIAFELSPNGIGCCRESPLYNFGNGTDGAKPYAGLVFDKSGNLYGTTVDGGVFGGGTAFELSPNGTGGWTETGLYSFGSSSSDGLNPYSGLIFDKSGNLYGTTQNGGLYSGGTAFELLPSNIGCCRESPLYSFGNGTDGRNPQAGLIFSPTGTLYGTTVNGGMYSGGTVFGITRLRQTAIPSSTAIR